MPQQGQEAPWWKIHTDTMDLCYLKTQNCDRTVEGAVLGGECLIPGLQGPLERSSLALCYQTSRTMSILPLAAT